MAKVPSAATLKYLRACVSGRPPLCNGCLQLPKLRLPVSSRNMSGSTAGREADTPIRKTLKKDIKAAKRADTSDASSTNRDSCITARGHSQYELTVGLEIHAELSTTRKLFSPAATSLNASPNKHVSTFDAAVPGTQPGFQLGTILPAVRAALALGCEIKHTSGWDRKHYFWWDQPHGYQITQYYDPFAINGSVTLNPSPDGVSHPVTIGIKQVQMEQDTAKTILQPPSTHLLDFNRVSHPLIEIITLPQIHDALTAVAFVRKVQRILKAVGACEIGMEMGGLRVDVNVSVRQIGRDSSASSGEMSGLGQRTEIKNLSTLAGISTAISLERDRQISILASGGIVEGETRGWTLGAVQTHRIRGKEGEVDYRYMPDPDLGPLVIGQDLVDMLRVTLPETPETTIQRLTSRWGVAEKDASTLVDLDDGERCEFFFDVAERVVVQSGRDRKVVGRTVSNWVVHELGALLSTTCTQFEPDIVSPEDLADILHLLLEGDITYPSAKSLLSVTLSGGLVDDAGRKTEIRRYVNEHSLRLDRMSTPEYEAMARELISEHEHVTGPVLKALKEYHIACRAQKQELIDFRSKTVNGKVMWFVGQMLRRNRERVQPEDAKRIIWHELEAELGRRESTGSEI